MLLGRHWREQLSLRMLAWIHNAKKKVCFDVSWSQCVRNPPFVAYKPFHWILVMMMITSLWIACVWIVLVCLSRANYNGARLCDAAQRPLRPTPKPALNVIQVILDYIVYLLVFIEYSLLFN